MSTITKTITQDLPEVLALLKLVDLPVEGVKEHFQDFFIIRNDEMVVGCVGIEIYENTGLLRSLAIHPSSQGKGLGQQMVTRIEEYSTEKELNPIYLLTDTAEKFFLKLDFEIIPREETDSRVKQSIEFTTLCPSSPVMMKVLKTK
ncbi:MAG: arsenic resistance N-acetyltransferase ArsN2 [Candidatus Hodarchaeales archaeon]|jgi:amino-acid N-acetyltransferase